MRTHRLLTWISVLAAFGLLASGCGGKKKAAESGGSAQQAVKTALTNASQINSGKLKFDATFSGATMPGGFKMSGDGAFDVKAKGGAAFQMSMGFAIAGQQQKIGFTAVDGKSYLEMGGQAFDMTSAAGPTGATSSTGKIDPAQLKDLIDKMSGFVTDVKQTGTATVDGESVTVYSAKINVAALLASAQNQVNKNLPNVPGIGDTKSLAGMIGDTTATIGIDNNQLPREFSFESTFKMPSSTTGAGAGGSGGFKVTLQLLSPNSPVTITKPANVTSGSAGLGALGSMFGGLGGATQ